MTIGERFLFATLVLTLTLLALFYQAITSGPKAAEARVTIRLKPQAIMAGGATWLTCRVPPNEHNRLLEYGVVDYRPGSQRDLEGDKAAVTFQTLVERIPCGVGPAYCAVRTDDGRWERAVLPIQVAGCDDGEVSSAR